MKDIELLAIVRREVDQAMGYDSDILATKRELALNYYNGIMSDPADGCSDVVSKDVADTVHALLTEITPIFQTSLIKFKPESEDDEGQAQLESDYVKYMFERSDGGLILYESSHDALLIGNGWIKVTMKETVDVTKEQYGLLEEFQIEQVQIPTEDNQEVSVSGNKTGITITRKTTYRNLVVESVSPESMIFANSIGQYNIKEVRMIGERVLFTTSELITDFKLSREEAKSIPRSGDEYWSGYRARQGIYQNETGEEQAVQDAEILHECFDLYIRVDLNNTGTSELRHVIYGGGVLVLNEPADHIPFATGSPVPTPHRIQGLGMFEIMAEVQDQKTNVLRKYMDNLDVMNGSRVEAVEGEVNMKDLTSGRVNGVVRVTAPGMVTPMPSTDIGAQAIGGLNYLDTVRSSRGGASVEQNNSDRQLMQSSATAAAGAIKTAERTTGWYAHNLVNTLLKNTFMLIHETLRKNMPGKVNANLRGKWVETDPGDWVERKHVETLAGLTTTERNNKISGLTQVIQRIDGMLQTGGAGIITDQSKLYGAMSDWINAAMIGQPEEYLIDPDSEEAQQAAQQQQQQAQASQQAMQQQQQQIMALQRQIEQEKVKYDYYKTDAELRFKYYDSQLEAEIKETDMTLSLVGKDDAE